MASRKLARDLFLSNSKRFFYRHLLTFSKGFDFKHEIKIASGKWIFVESNQEFQQSVKKLKEKAEELKGVKEDLKVRTKQTTEQLYKQVDGAWTEAEATAKKVKGTFRIGRQDSEFTSTSAANQDSGFSSTPAEDGTDEKTGSKTTSGDETQQKSGTDDTAYTIFGKFTSSVSSVSPKVSMAFQKLKEAKPIDWAKAGYDVVKDELSGNPSKRKRIEYGASSSTSSSTGERSTKTDVAVVASKQGRWGKKWEAFKEKMQGHPVFKHFSGLSEPVVVKSQEFAEDMRDRWETTDNPVVHKIQDLSESVFGETATAVSFKEIRRRDPSFSLPDFVTEVQEVVKPALNAYFKGNVEVLKKYCSNEVIERCKAEHQGYESQGIYFDNKDTIHTVYYAWAMQQVDVEELGEGALFPMWRLREMQQLGVKALI
ncbi:translocase inner membrane subunit 44-2 [Actinidia rufa]|uniref:Translocase inner membrane subunit 44-2 n=1 Tax=Actinidia rufa TaxID=165716 RepID=A0A7J0FLJ4_9ERIC|nr:translocase inner membrane subunit 44-2 [Actinidia rufa]